MPANVVQSKRDEHLWSQAKKIAKEAGRSKDYAYIMGVYQRSKGVSKGLTPEELQERSKRKKAAKRHARLAEDHRSSSPVGGNQMGRWKQEKAHDEAEEAHREAADANREAITDSSAREAADDASDEANTHPSVEETEKAIRFDRRVGREGERLIIQKSLRKAKKVPESQLDLFGSRPAAKPKAGKPRSGGPFIGPRGGKWQDAQHTIPWKEGGGGSALQPTMYRQAKAVKHREEHQRLLKIRETLKPGNAIYDKVRGAIEANKRAAKLYERAAADGASDSAAKAKEFGERAENASIEANKALTRSASSKASQPSKKTEEAIRAIMESADNLGIPVERAGPRSVALGGVAAWDRDLGKWNGENGDRGRRVASIAKAGAWLKAKAEEVRRVSRLSDERLAAKKKRDAEFDAKMRARRSAGFVLRGRTYPIKEEIKQAGGVWDREAKAWLMPDAESMRAMKDKIATLDRQSASVSRPTPAPRKASPRQVNYALSLIRRLREDDYGTFTTFGFQHVTREKLEGYSAADVSGMIAHLREEIF
jgi:hypothetical protein